MQHLTLILEAALAEALHPYCGEAVFWCVAGVEYTLPLAILVAVLVLWRSIA